MESKEALLKIDHYNVIQLLGKGESGIIYLVDTHMGEVFAVKVLKHEMKKEKVIGNIN